MTAPPGPPAPPLPAGLRDRVLAAARQARAAGRPVPEAQPISGLEAFRRTAAALDRLLAALRPDDWAAAALRNLDVQGLVGHLIGVEEDTQRALAGDPEVADAGHISATDPAAARQAGRPPGDTLAEWRRVLRRTLQAAGAAGDSTAGDGGRGPVFALHGLRLPLDLLLVARAFELWTHDNDIRRAAGRPPSVPDTSTLQLMTGLAAQALPLGAARTGLAAPARLHLVLTGPGGGTWDVMLGEGTREPAALRIITDAVDFCRLVANRMPPAQLALDVAGDPDCAAGVLAAAAALAFD